MTYWTQTVMSTDYYMVNRVAACAAEQGEQDSDQWSHDTRREWSAAPVWGAAWDYYLLSNPEPPPDSEEHAKWVPPGMNSGVISDGMILSQVQVMLGLTTTKSVQLSEWAQKAAVCWFHRLGHNKSLKPPERIFTT